MLWNGYEWGIRLVDENVKATNSALKQRENVEYFKYVGDIKNGARCS